MPVNYLRHYSVFIGHLYFFSLNCLFMSFINLFSIGQFIFLLICCNFLHIKAIEPISHIADIFPCIITLWIIYLIVHKVFIYAHQNSDFWSWFSDFEKYTLIFFKNKYSDIIPVFYENFHIKFEFTWNIFWGNFWSRNIDR